MGVLRPFAHPQTGILRGSRVAKWSYPSPDAKVSAQSLGREKRILDGFARQNDANHHEDDPQYPLEREGGLGHAK